jgi:hypothetical protein
MPPFVFMATLESLSWLNFDRIVSNSKNQYQSEGYKRLEYRRMKVHYWLDCPQETTTYDVNIP